MKLYYLPTNWTELTAWLRNLLNEITCAAALLNERPEDIAAVQVDTQELLDAITAADLAAENLRKSNAVKLTAKK